MEGIKEATYKVGDLEVNVAVVSGLANARKVLDAIKAGEKNSSLKIFLLLKQ